MIRAVMDISILVSAIISPNGPNAQVFDNVSEELFGIDGTDGPYSGRFLRVRSAAMTCVLE